LGSTAFSLWTDEGWTIWYVEAQNPITTIELLLENRHPPLYFIVVSIWQNFAGNSLLALRFVGIASGLITTALVYRMGADWFNKSTGLYAAAIFAVLDIAVYYTQEVRHYGWLTMFAMLTSFLFLRYLRRPRQPLWIGYALSVTGLMLTHYFGLFIMVLQAFFGMIIWNGNFAEKRRLFAGWILSFVLYLPWFIVVLATLSTITRGVGGFPGSFTSTYDDLLKMLELLFGGQIALLGGTFLIGVLNQERLTTQRWYILAAGGGMFIALFWLNTVVGVLSTRMIYFMAPMLVIIVGYGLTRFSTRYANLLVIGSVLVSLTTTPILQPRINSRGVSELLQGQYTPGDLIMLELGWTDFTLRYELLQSLPAAAEDVFSTVWLWEPEDIVADAEQRLQNYERVWVIQWLHAPVVLPRLDDGWLGYETTYSENVPNTEEVVTSSPIIVRMYQRPVPIEENPLAAYDNGLILQDAIFDSTPDLSLPLHVDLWWQTAAPLPLDYSAGVLLRDVNGGIVWQEDSALTNVPSSQWAVDTLHHGRHTLTLPEDLPPGDYSLSVVVYYFEDATNPLQADHQTIVDVGVIQVRE